MGQLVVDEQAVKGAAGVVVGYFGVFFFTVSVQLVDKVRSLKDHAEEKKRLVATGQDVKDFKYSRYDDANIIASDRAIGNYVEWAPAFLSLLAAHTAVVGDCSKLAWAYVGFRLLYVILAKNGGVTRSGPQPLIFLATFPMYGVLFTMAARIAKAVYQ